MKTLSLNVFGIVITWNSQNRESAAITSTMKESDTIDNHAFNTGVDAIEAMILAHFCAGIDLMESAYRLTTRRMSALWQILKNQCHLIA